MTLKVIEDMYPGTGVLGRKVDMLAKAFLQMKASTGGRKMNGEFSKTEDIRKFMEQEGVIEWPVRRIARVLNCSKSSVNLVRIQLLGKGAMRKGPRSSHRTA